MKKHLHWFAIVAFLLALLYDCALWGAISRIPDLGEKLEKAARREAVLANIYMTAGAPIASAVPIIDEWGQNYFQIAAAEGIPRMKDDPSVAFDLIFSQGWNARHRTLKITYWAPPVLAILALIMWVRRPKKISLMGRR